jgi:hypothetical protein
MFCDKKSGSEGFAMIAVLGYVMGITMLSAAFMVTFRFSLDVQQKHLRTGEAFATAESGIHYGAALLAENESFTGIREVSIGDHQIVIHIEPGIDSNSWKIRSTAYLGGTQFTLHEVALDAVLHRTASGWQVTHYERVHQPIKKLEEET